MALADNPSWIALTRGTVEARSRSYGAPRSTTPVTPEHAAQLLTAEVQRSIMQGATVEYTTDTTAVLQYRSSTNHLVHAVLTLLTFGFWLIVWLVALVIAKPSRVMLTVDECGNISREHIRR